MKQLDSRDVVTSNRILPAATKASCLCRWGRGRLHNSGRDGGAKSAYLPSPFRTACLMLAVAPMMWGARNEGTSRINSPVQLLAAVEVKGGRVRLSDLLPADAPLLLQKVSAKIDLCPAPQPGSVRVLDAEQVTSKLAGQPELLRQLIIPPQITVRSSGWPIAEAAVRMAISNFLRRQSSGGELPEAAMLEGLQPLAAVEEHPTLEVMGLDWDHRRQSVEVRLRCQTRASCGSFLVHVVLPPGVGEQWHERFAPRAGSNSSAGQLAAAGGGVVLAEKGKLATLVLDGGSMRMSLRVICLEAGVMNQEIRVLDEKSRHLFHAEVVGAGLLRASL
jgi:hypothetical protein